MVRKYLPVPKLGPQNSKCFDLQQFARMRSDYFASDRTSLPFATSNKAHQVENNPCELLCLQEPVADF